MRNKLTFRYEDWAHFRLRITAGIVFTAHGVQKLFGVFGGSDRGEALQLFQQLQINPALLWLFVVGLIEFVSGLAVLFGMLTRLAAGLLSLVMIEAIVRLWPNGFSLPQGYEYSLVLLGAAIALALGGAGKLSLDGYFKLREHRKRAE
jgi:putative oxidoreductase